MHLKAISLAQIYNLKASQGWLNFIILNKIIKDTFTYAIAKFLNKKLGKVSFKGLFGSDLYTV